MKTQVHFGKPTAQKISQDVDVRSWDPTDPDEKNPWKEYVNKTPEPSDKQSSMNNTNNTNNTSNTNKTSNTNTNTNKRKQYT